MRQTRLLTLLLLVFYAVACNKKEPDQPVVNNPPPEDSFTIYTIKAGQNYAEGTTYPAFNLSSLKFKAILDSSCIYQTVDTLNQLDINKLYGFSDCGSFHQVNSARFGWNWSNGQMHIHAYCYVNSVRNSKELGTVDINKAFTCRLDVSDTSYIFTLNNQSDTMSRYCSDSIAQGYKLIPYFGGDEPAPHDMIVRIMELP